MFIRRAKRSPWCLWQTFCVRLIHTKVSAGSSLTLMIWALKKLTRVRNNSIFSICSLWDVSDVHQVKLLMLSVFWCSRKVQPLFHVHIKNQEIPLPLQPDYCYRYTYMQCHCTHTYMYTSKKVRELLAFLTVPW